MLPRVLEPEVMDSPEEACAYDAMDHDQVNQVFVTDLLAFAAAPGRVLDVGTGTARIPIELCRRNLNAQVLGVDLAAYMLAVAKENVRRAGLQKRIELQRIDAKGLPLPTATFEAVISNSIVHHIPQPRVALAEMARVAAPGGALFVRDLLRPASADAVEALARQYAAGASPHQRRLFEDSLRAALTLDEIRAVIAAMGFEPAQVAQTSDRHWTWACLKT